MLNPRAGLVEAAADEGAGSVQCLVLPGLGVAVHTNSYAPCDVWVDWPGSGRADWCFIVACPARATCVAVPGARRRGAAAW